MVDVEKELGEEEMKVTIENSHIIDINKEIPIANSDGEYIGLSRIDSEFTSVFFNVVKRGSSRQRHRFFMKRLLKG